jgi:hypothetical protein
MYGNGGVHLGRGLFRSFDYSRKKGIAVIRQIQGKMVTDGGGRRGRGLYVKITDQVKRTKKCSQGKEAETDYARPEEILHGKEYGFLKGKSEDGHRPAPLTPFSFLLLLFRLFRPCGKSSFMTRELYPDV